MPILSKSREVFEISLSATGEPRLAAYAPRHFFYVLLFCLAPIALGEPTIDPQAAAKEMVQSEINFSKTAGEKGIKESFIQFFADNSIIFFGDAPENGKQHYSGYQEKGFLLHWQPAFAAIAASGEIGMTTGPWEIRKTPADKIPMGYGQFFSIWKKQPDNQWKVLFDTGTENQKPASDPREVKMISPAKSGSTDISERKRTLEEAEKDFAKALKNYAGEGMLSFASEHICLLRDEAFPITDKATAAPILAKDISQQERKTIGGEVSESYDFAYRYGSYKSVLSGVSQRGLYVMVWRMDQDGRWKILADLQKKTPEPK